MVLARGLQDEAPELAGDVGRAVESEGALGAGLAGIDDVEGGGGPDGQVGDAVPGVGIEGHRHGCCGAVS